MNDVDVDRAKASAGSWFGICTSCQRLWSSSYSTLALDPYCRQSPTDRGDGCGSRLRLLPPSQILGAPRRALEGCQCPRCETHRSTFGSHARIVSLHDPMPPPKVTVPEIVNIAMAVARLPPQKQAEVLAAAREAPMLDPNNVPSFDAKKLP